MHKLFLRNYLLLLVVVLAACSGGGTSSGDPTESGTGGTGGTGGAGALDLSVATYQVQQTDGALTVTVNRTAGSSGAVSVNYATSSGTAVAGTDYTDTSGTLDWADGDTTAQTFTVPISNASAFFGSKTFSMSLSSPTNGATLGVTATATATISGSAASGVLSLSSSSYSVVQNAGSLTVTVTRTGGNTAESVQYATSDGSAVAGVDYTSTSGTLDWAASDTASKTFTVAVSNATPFSGSKTFTITLSNPTSATLGTSSAAATIVGTATTADGVLSLSSSTYSVAQSASMLTVTVTRTGGNMAESVHYATSNGTAIAGTDYTATSGTLNWTAGDTTSKTFTVAISNATPFSGSKAFSVTLSSPSSATLGISSATATITGGATNGVLSLSASTYSVTQSAGTLTVTVTRTGGNTAESVHYATSNGTAIAGTDYTATGGTLNWTAGDTTSKTFTVAISSTTPFSGSKAFTVTLSSPTSATLGASAATVTITGSATNGVLSLSASTYSVAQSAGTLTVTVTRTGGNTAESVHYATSNGTAIAGTDYTATGGTLNWTAGDTTSKTFTVAVSNATPFSGNKTFTITLSNPTSATLGTSSAAATITGSQGTSGLMSGLHVVMGTGGAAGHIVNGSGQNVQLRGADRAGSEWNCIWGVNFNDHVDQTSVDAMKAWGINAVRVPLNEDCWLGINGVQTSSSFYQAAVKNYVDLLTANGMAVILDLHWAAPGTVQANGQLGMADADHAPTFWSQVAAAYSSNSSVIFDLFNEPFITDWNCWLKGAAASANCAQDYSGNAYSVAGMATLLKAVRDAGAQNIIMMGGLGYASDYSQWVAKVNSIPTLAAPLDGLSLSNVAVSWHTYSEQSVQTLCPTQYNGYDPHLVCASAQTTVTNYGIPALLSAGYTVIIGEIGIGVYSSNTGSYTATQAQYLATWLDGMLTWMDQQGQSYLGWDWNTVADPLLISNFDGTPTPYFGVTFQAHVSALAGTP